MDGTDGCSLNNAAFKFCTNVTIHAMDVHGASMRMMQIAELQPVAVPFSPLPTPSASVPAQAAGSFDAILESERLRFSAHAQTRLASRGVGLTSEDLARLEDAVAKAERKGARDAFVMLRDMVFIVSVKNRTVITALKADQAQENVFTNIDAAVIV
jgi:flagellar operon protein